MPLSDQEIIARVKHQGMIDPFVVDSVREGVVSYGLSSSGYDMRLGSEFVIFHKMPGEHYYGQRIASKEHVGRFPLLDPKNQHAETGEYINVGEGYCLVLQPGDYALGSTVERLKLPSDIMAIFLGKSTYARCGLIVNVTPGEAGWGGWLTIELANPTTLPVVVYPQEGVLQAVFFKIDGEVQKSYADKKGKYHMQPDEPTRAKIDGLI